MNAFYPVQPYTDWSILLDLPNFGFPSQNRLETLAAWGGLLSAGGGRIPSLDFAGGTVVHVTSGVSALVTAIYLGKRIGYPHTNMPPHSMVLSFIGACLLWVGWFGFNAGSALGSGPLATSAFVNTHFAAAAAALGWTIAEWIHNGKPTALGAISGAVAGLVAITPASGFVQPFSALLIGLIAGVFCSFMVFEVKSRLGYDDSLDAFGVHGAGGTLGALLTGLFATRRHQRRLRQRCRHRRHRRPLGSDAQPGRGRGNRLAARCSRNSGAPFRRRQNHRFARLARGRSRGLDLSQHGEEGYDLNSLMKEDEAGPRLQHRSA